MCHGMISLMFRRQMNHQLRVLCLHAEDGPVQELGSMRAAGVEPVRRTFMARETKVLYDIWSELFYRDESGFLYLPKLSGYSFCR